VRHFGQLAREHFGPDWAAHLSGVAIASIGPQTSEACQDLFGRVDVEAWEYTLEGLTEALGVWATRR
jgi:uroporphyrinogen-III synthase